MRSSRTRWGIRRPSPQLRVELGAAFYRPQYWQSRTKNGNVKTACTGAVADGRREWGPRTGTRVTDEEPVQLITMWMQSSVRDYAGDPAQDMSGLGVTGLASARFFYGDVGLRHTNPNIERRRRSARDHCRTDSFGGLLGIRTVFARPPPPAWTSSTTRSCKTNTR